MPNEKRDWSTTTPEERRAVVNHIHSDIQDMRVDRESIEEETGHDVVALLESLAKHIGGE